MKSVQIKDIGRVVTGKTPATAHPEYYGGDILFVTPPDMISGFVIRSTERTITDEGLRSIRSNSINGRSILVSCIGDIGRVAITECTCATNQQINAITDINDDLYDAWYVYYKVSTLKDRFFSCAGCTVVPILAKSAFEEIEIPDIPLLDEQKKISNVLSSIDRKIALNRKRIATLEAMAKEIYDYWFVQFDFPDAHGRPYKSSGGAMVYNPDLKREIPKGWEVCEIGCLSEIKSGYPFRSDALIENGVHGVITIKNVQDYQLNLSQLCYINEIPEGMPDFCKVQNGACLMSLTGYVGRICRVHKVGFLLNQRVGVVIPKVESREWLYAMLGEQGLRAKINYLATGCAQANVSPVDIGKIRVPLPTSELRNRYDEIAKYLMAEIFACRKECDELASLRDFLLPVLMNGQVKMG